MKRRLHSIHKYLGLFLAIFWVAQAASGIAIGFRSEIDDWQLRQSVTPVQPARLGSRLMALEADGSAVSAMWASGGVAGQFDIYLTDRDGVDRTIRVDGAGQVVRDRRDSQLFTDGAIFETLTRFHQTLLIGDGGALLVGLSGIVLLANILVGVRLAWRRSGMIASMVRPPAGRQAARLFGWHRLVGLWFAVPALLLVASGVLLAFEQQVEQLLGGEIARPEATPPAALGATGPGNAIGAALAVFPGSNLTAVTLPQRDSPWYRVRVRASGEIPRKYGATTVYVSPTDSKILLVHDARRSGAARRTIETLYPLHTGQLGLLPGRLLNLSVGAWLMAMVMLGLLLWRKRQAAAATARSSQGPSTQVMGPPPKVCTSRWRSRQQPHPTRRGRA